MPFSLSWTTSTAASGEPVANRVVPVLATQNGYSTRHKNSALPSIVKTMSSKIPRASSCFRDSRSLQDTRRASQQEQEGEEEEQQEEQEEEQEEQEEQEQEQEDQ